MTWTCFFRAKQVFCIEMERRQHRRVPAQVNALLRVNSHEIEGQTVDVSLGGARMESDLAVQPGKQVVVKLLIPGVRAPVYVEQAQVQWVHDQTFGVQFLAIRQGELDELEQLIDECIALDERGDP